MKMTIKTGDTVLVIAGKEKGKTGKVTAVYAGEGRVLVDGINMVSKHQKPRSQQDKGGIIKKNAPIDVSNVQVVCPVCNKATRVAHAEVGGKKARVCKKCGGALDKEFVKQTKKEAKKTIKAEELKGAKLKSAKTEKAAEEAKPVEKKTAAKKTTAKATESKETKAAPKAKAAKAEETEVKAEKPAKTTAAKKTTTKTAAAKAEKPAKEAAEKKTTTKKSTTAKKETK
jgi:large subunit ribosomal protein L24